MTRETTAKQKTQHNTQKKQTNSKTPKTTHQKKQKQDKTTNQKHKNPKTSINKQKSKNKKHKTLPGCTQRDGSCRPLRGQALTFRAHPPR